MGKYCARIFRIADVEHRDAVGLRRGADEEVAHGVCRADVEADELREIVGESAMDNDTANAIIMKAREHGFPPEEQAAGEEAKA